MKEITNGLTALIETVRALRGVNGCPWDKKQTTDSLKRYLNEEYAEIIIAIEKDDRNNLCEELGDFLFLILMLSEINEEEKQFSFREVIKGINNKLIRRHPHVFAEKRQISEEELKKQWQAIKASEKK